MMSSSRVRQVPPAPTILALALSVKRRAATVNFGTSNSLSSSVIVVTATTVLSCFFPRCLINLVSESGGLLTLDETSLRTTVLQNLDSVLLDKNLKSCTESEG